MMAKVIKFEDLKKFRFRRKRGSKATKIPENLSISISWTEYHGEDPVDKSITFDPHSKWETLKLDGKKIVVEKCLQIVGTLYDSDPSLEAELREKLEHLFSENKDDTR